MKQKEIPDEKLTNIWRITRARCNRSQEYMAFEMGVARKTIQNWEKGVSYPTFDQVMKWFRILGISPLPYLYQYAYPCVEKLQTNDEEKLIRDSLECIIKELPVDLIRQLLFLFYGDHGSSPRAVMQLVTAHLQTPMRDRVTQANIIVKHYELAEKKNQLTNKDHVKPDMELLNKAILNAEQAVLKDMNSYPV